MIVYQGVVENEKGYVNGIHYIQYMCIRILTNNYTTQTNNKNNGYSNYSILWYRDIVMLEYVLVRR